MSWGRKEKGTPRSGGTQRGAWLPEQSAALGPAPVCPSSNERPANPLVAALLGPLRQRSEVGDPMWGEGDDLACRGHPLDPPCLQPCGQFREGSLPCARCGGHCCPSPLCASLCRVGWGVGRMTAGTVVITGGILATVILLCIIAVLCYCRLQVSPPGLWAVATRKPLPHYGDGSQRPSSGVTKPKAMGCRRRESQGWEPGTIRRKLCVPHTLRTLGQPQRACWEGSGPLYCAPCTSETSGVVGRAPFWGHPRPCPQCDSYAPPSLPPCVSQPRPGATALGSGRRKGEVLQGGESVLVERGPWCRV